MGREELKLIKQNRKAFREFLETEPRCSSCGIPLKVGTYARFDMCFKCYAKSKENDY